jgi:hypothetical protein
MEYISTPQILYHGTIQHHLSSFREKLLNSRFWRPGRDFGEGFYTTTSLAQARKWARKAEKTAVPASSACILEIELTDVPARFVPQVFLGASPAWGEYIFVHRRVSRINEDPCKRHADLIVGPMADNDTGKIVQEALLLNKDDRWFYEKITRSVKGKRLDVLGLGNQVVFSSELWESSLRLTGYHIYTGGRWHYHENSGTAELV